MREDLKIQTNRLIKLYNFYIFNLNYIFIPVEKNKQKLFFYLKNVKIIRRKQFIF